MAISFGIASNELLLAGRARDGVRITAQLLRAFAAKGDKADVVAARGKINGPCRPLRRGPRDSAVLDLKKDRLIAIDLEHDEPHAVRCIPPDDDGGLRLGHLVSGGAGDFKRNRWRTQCLPDGIRPAGDES